MDKLINQLEKKSKGVWSLTHLEKIIQKWIYPNYAFYGCLNICEIESNSENSLEEYV